MIILVRLGSYDDGAVDLCLIRILEKRLNGIGLRAPGVRKGKPDHVIRVKMDVRLNEQAFRPRGPCCAGAQCPGYELAASDGRHEVASSQEYSKTGWQAKAPAPHLYLATKSMKSRDSSAAAHRGWPYRHRDSFSHRASGYPAPTQ